MAWAYLGLRAVLVLSRCVSCCAAVSPCIAVVTDIWRTESGRSQRFTEPLAPPDLRCWPSSVQGQPGAEVHWWSTVWPTHSPRDPGAVAGTLLISGYRLGPWRSCAAWRRGAYCALTTPGSRPRLPGLRMACRMQRPATDEPAPRSAPRRFPLTFD